MFYYEYQLGIIWLLSVNQSVYLESWLHLWADLCCDDCMSVYLCTHTHTHSLTTKFVPQRENWDVTKLVTDNLSWHNLPWQQAPSSSSFVEKCTSSHFIFFLECVCVIFQLGMSTTTIQPQFIFYATYLTLGVVFEMVVAQPALIFQITYGWKTKMYWDNK